MTFRDDGDAARARARALEDALAEKEAQVEALQAKLAKRDEALQDAQEDLASVRDAERKLVALKNQSRPRAKRRAEKRDREERERAEAESESDAKEREQRRLSSVSVWARVDLLMLFPFFLLPTIFGMIYVGTQHSSRWIVAVPICAALLLFAVKYFGRDWARRQWRLETEWAESHPYELVGYPAILEQRPSSSRGDIMRLDDDAHQVLKLEIDFVARTVPDDLAEVMAGFDEALSPSNPADESPFAHMTKRALGQTSAPETQPNVFYRRSPVTTERSKSGTEWTADHNRAVRDWVRRLDREALAPLHARHGVERVVLRLL